MASPKPRLPRPLLVRDLMTEHVFTLRPNDDLADACELMDARHVRHVPIVDGEGDLVGLVTERDLSRGIFDPREELPLSTQRDLLHRRRIREVMATEVESVDPEGDLRTAAEMLIENKVGCLPVVEGSHVVGILTEADFVRLFVGNGDGRPLGRA